MLLSRDTAGKIWMNGNQPFIDNLPITASGFICGARLYIKGVCDNGQLEPEQKEEQKEQQAAAASGDSINNITQVTGFNPQDLDKSFVEDDSIRELQIPSPASKMLTARVPAKQAEATAVALADPSAAALRARTSGPCKVCLAMLRISTKEKILAYAARSCQYADMRLPGHIIEYPEHLRVFFDSKVYLERLRFGYKNNAVFAEKRSEQSQ